MSHSSIQYMCQSCEIPSLFGKKYRQHISKPQFSPLSNCSYTYTANEWAFGYSYPDTSETVTASNLKDR